MTGATDESSRRLCRLCGERPVPPSRVRAGDYRCSLCRRRTPAEQATHRRYRAGERRRAVSRRTNAKRIRVGQVYHSYAATAEAARLINAHIKTRLAAFRAAQREEWHVAK